MEEIHKALRFGGGVGYSAEPLAFDRAVTIDDQQDALLVEFPWGSDFYVAGIAPQSTGWTNGTWRSRSACAGKWRARRYVDPQGEVWLCEWDEDGERWTVILDAKGRRDPATRRTDGHAAWIEGPSEGWFGYPVERAILRNDRELVVAFDYDSIPYEARLLLGGSGWRGSWTRGRNLDRGSCRARVLADGDDLLLLGEWDEAGATSALIADLRFEKRVV